MKAKFVRGVMLDLAPLYVPINPSLWRMMNDELNVIELKAEKLDNAIAELKELIEYGEQQWDGQPINKGMLEGLRESVRIMEGKQ